MDMLVLDRSVMIRGDRRYSLPAQECVSARKDLLRISDASSVNGDNLYAQH